LAVGIVLTKKIGDPVQKGEPLAIIHSNTENVDRSLSLIQNHIHIDQQPVKIPQLIFEMITG
jgi:pyrimidine-nucleoside phosphorylase